MTTRKSLAIVRLCDFGALRAPHTSSLTKKIAHFTKDRFRSYVYFISKLPLVTKIGVLSKDEIGL